MNGHISHRALAEILAAIVALFLIAVGIGVGVWEYQQKANAEANAAAQEKLIADSKAQNQELQQALADSQKQMASLVADTNAKIEGIQQQRQAAVTPDQLAALIAQITGTKPTVVTVPGQAPVATLPLPDLSKLADFSTECEKCKVSLDSAQQQITQLNGQNQNLQEQVKNTMQQLTAEEKVAQGYKTAMLGGTFMQRFKHDASAGLGAAAGAGIGAAICSHSQGATVVGCAAAGALIGMAAKELKL